MKYTTLLASIGAIVLGAGVAAFGPAVGSAFEITKFTIDGGGGTSSSGAFAVSGTIGQFDAGPGSTGMSGGDFVLIGGFHPIVAVAVPTCPADLSGDGSIGFADLSALLASWGSCPGCAADLDGSGSVGFADLSTLLAAWGACP